MLGMVRDKESLKNEVEELKRRLDDLYKSYLPLIDESKQKPIVVGQDMDFILLKTLEKFVPQDGEEYELVIRVKHRANGIRWEIEEPVW
jgi:2-hydroxy-3-keto-5-methylthiopentenyl-1-phosphate phosphatase